jgi:hypothetical protein
MNAIAIRDTKRAPPENREPAYGRVFINEPSIGKRGQAPEADRGSSMAAQLECLPPLCLNSGAWCKKHGFPGARGP